MPTHKLSALLALLCLALLTGCSKPEFPTLSGQGFTPRSGDWQLINYWADWCGPCREEIPALNNFQAKRGINIVGVNYDGLEGDELALSIEDMGIEFDSLLSDPATALGQHRPQILPVTFVVSPDGEVSQVLTGPQTEASLAAAIDKPI